MNDNLRYVSLQYIKGDNYEDVDSFKVDIRGVLNRLKDADLLDNPEAVTELYGKLVGLQEKKKIGESFLEDLINYSSLKLIKTDLDAAKKKAEDKIKKLKKETGGKGDGNEKKGDFINARSKIARLLLDVKEVLDMVKRGDISEPPAVLDDTTENVLKRTKDYLLGVETAQVKITKIGDKITELETQVNDTNTDKGTLLQHITSDFEKLKANAINSVKKFQSDAKINNIDDNISILLIEFNFIKEASYTKINIKDISSSFSKIKQSLKDAAEAAALDKAALEKAAAAAKAMVLFGNVEFAITKLNKEIDNVNANVAILTELNKEVAKLKELNTTAIEVKKAAEALKKAKAPAALAALAALAAPVPVARRVAAPAVPVAQTPQEAQEALSAALKKIEPLLETAKTDLEGAYKLLEELRKSVIEQSDALEKDKKDYLKNLDKLVALYISYLNICTKNILKYDRLFEHNEISNIDEAFMIKSYSDFLKKLNKLKQNLETKDMGKIKRALTDSINQLFNMYGVNTNNEAFMKAFLEGYYDDNGKFKNNGDPVDEKKKKDIDYIIDRIINYNLAK